jgi:hypothetical protein
MPKFTAVSVIFSLVNLTCRKRLRLAAADGNESENDSTFAVRDTARGSKNQTIGGSIKSAFRAAIRVITGEADEEPTPRRKRRGETEGEFQRQARLLARRSRVRSLIQQFGKRAKRIAQYRRIIRLTLEEWGPPDAHLSDTRALTSQWNTGGGVDYGSGPGGAQPTNTNHISPRL